MSKVSLPKCIEYAFDTTITGRTAGDNRWKKQVPYFLEFLMMKLQLLYFSRRSFDMVGHGPFVMKNILVEAGTLSNPKWTNNIGKAML